MFKLYNKDEANYWEDVYSSNKSAVDELLGALGYTLLVLLPIILVICIYDS